MLGKIKERCLYCGGDVYYHSGEHLTKCEWCGHTLVTTKFENELERMNAALEEGEAAKHALENAEKERDRARLRLEKAMGALEGIHGSQRNVDKALTRIASDFSNNKDNQREMKNLLIAIKGQVSSGEDTLSRILAMISSSQQNGEAKLADLSHLADGILKNQDNMLTALTLLPPLTEKLDLNAQQQNQLVSDFMNWFQNIRQSDVKRLKSIAVSSDHLLKAQTALEKKMDSLQQTAKDMQTMVEGFNREYNRDKLEKLQTLYRQAENAQLDQDFDLAAERYLEVEAAGGEDVETCWRRIICHYCIYYQKDVKKRISVPIILNPDLRDPGEMSLRREMEKKLLTEKEEVRKIYHDNLAEIDKILESYRHARLETGYDVFISVKQSDDIGRYTSDSDKASDLYDFLTRRGYNVFNSRRSLRANEIYEPRIIAALMSSKVMIVVGSSPENMNSDWVKNEWSRFTWLQRRENGSKKQILCYLTGDMDPYTIPKGLNPDKQAIIDGINAHEELIDVLNDVKAPCVGRGTVSTTSQHIDYIQIERQLKFWLLQGKFDKVQEKYEQLTEEGMFLEHISLHLAVLCANNQIRSIGELANSEIVLDQMFEFKAAQMFCQNKEEIEKLDELLKRNREWRNSALKNNYVESDINTTIDQAEESPEEWYRLGEEAYEKGNYEEEVKWFRKAAERGYAEAQNDLGFCYRYGEGTEKDDKLGVYWYRMAAEAGHGEAQNNLGVCYKDGIGVEKDEEQAVFWFCKAAKQGVPAAQYNIGECYDYGIGVEKNEEQAVIGYRKAAEAGHGAAQDILGDCYLNGRGVPKDLDEAVKWFRKAAEAGITTSMIFLGECLLDPSYKNANPCEGEKWLRRAAEQGNTDAQTLLAFFIIGGVVNGENTEAVQWFQKAAEQGDEKAREILKSPELKRIVDKLHQDA